MIFDPRSKRKQDKIDPQDLRDHCVSVRLNSQELAALDECRKRMRRGEALRALAFYEMPRPIPQINSEVWTELSKSASNLNQLAHHLNSGGDVQINEVRRALDDFRSRLIGV